MQTMNTSFWESNLFQTLVLIVTVGATIGIALWQFHAHKRKELRNAVSILLLQINDIEKNIEYILSEGLINGYIQEVPIHYSTIIFEENQWNKYAHSVVGHISQEAFEKIDTFFKVAQRIREQQIYIKQKIQLSTENKAFYYYSAVYNQIVIASQPTQSIQSIVDRFNDTVVPSYIQKELALGLEKTLKQYHKLSDGIAYTELAKLKQ
ncbi:hypothetical protein CE91St3_08030 [Parabacteroides merdae]|jgi:hypothetical protein|uniref:Uncharacterized protein n=2 Tax=Bacteroidia TaxID=200643 RepID=A0AA37NDL5_9BACT|nr:hypothetical protein CE91St3_08030 [Parabacteroides merdae]